MRPRVLVTLLVALAALALQARTADVLRECGVWIHRGQGVGTARRTVRVRGAGISNVITRRVTCRWAPKVSPLVGRPGRRPPTPPVQVPLRQCVVQLADIRCRRARKVIRWQTGS